jgi:SSS family solute:Na+ symporter
MTLPSLIALLSERFVRGWHLAPLASFMSGMAGNVTAFNSVFTYDIYQSYFVKINPTGIGDGGKDGSVAGVLFSICTAYIAKSFNNINDFLQLVFSFVNGPLFATFYWECSGNEPRGMVLLWLASGTAAAAVTHGLTGRGKGGLIVGVWEIEAEWARHLLLLPFHGLQILPSLFCKFGNKTKTGRRTRTVYSLTKREPIAKSHWYLNPVTQWYYCCWSRSY